MRIKQRINIDQIERLYTAFSPRGSINGHVFSEADLEFLRTILQGITDSFESRDNFALEIVNSIEMARFDDTKRHIKDLSFGVLSVSVEEVVEELELMVGEGEDVSTFMENLAEQAISHQGSVTPFLENLFDREYIIRSAIRRFGK